MKTKSQQGSPANTGEEHTADDLAARRAARFGSLPARTLPEQMVEEQPSDPPQDPRFHRDPDTDWLIRYCL